MLKGLTPHSAVPSPNAIRRMRRLASRVGDLAYDTGHFTATGLDGSILNTGKWIVIWKRESSGNWKIHRDFMAL